MKSQKKLLPPLEKSNLLTAQSPNQDTVFNTSKSIRMDTSSPLTTKAVLPRKFPSTTTNKEAKDTKFFLTSELTPHYLNDGYSNNMEPSMISKVSPR